VTGQLLAEFAVLPGHRLVAVSATPMLERFELTREALARCLALDQIASFAVATGDVGKAQKVEAFAAARSVRRVFVDRNAPGGSWLR
jgi:hypothetical protein